MILARLLALLLLILSVAVPAYADNMPMDNFRKIPIQHEGRIKPLDTFARVTLETFSGKDRTDDASATAWLAEALLDPVSSASRPVFLIRNANTRHRMGLQERANALYAYTELTAGLGKTINDISPLYKKLPATLTEDEKELLRIHQNAILYTQILRTLSLILPLNVELTEYWSKKIGKSPEDGLSYLDLRKTERDIEVETRAIIERKGDNPDKYTDEERQTALLSYQLKLLGDAAASNQLMRIIPVGWSEAQGEWQSPWAVLQGGHGSPDTGAILQLWRDLADAWQKQDAQAWVYNGQQAYQMPLYMGGKASDFWRLELEVLYNGLKPFDVSTGFYAIGFLLAIGFLITPKGWLYWSSVAALSIGALIHTGGIAGRIVILERPPVSTLYESMIFVSLVCVIAGLWLEKRLKNGAGLLTASLTGIFVGLMAQSFNTAEDSLKMLSAVLDTRFWLATHVLCITFGYGWCIVASLLAHLDLASRAFRPARSYDLAATLNMTCLITLLFTATGTILGGIWADQSWGRFWGWDPKENGALLIVLWLVWLLHGKLSGHLKPVALLASQAFLSVIVGAAWLGVNLLGVGLHSYGFADGLFWGLGIFTGVEVALIGAMWYLSIQNAQKNSV